MVTNNLPLPDQQLVGSWDERLSSFISRVKRETQRRLVDAALICLPTKADVSVSLQNMEVGGGNMNMRKLLKCLQQEVISGRKRFFSPERSRESSCEEDEPSKSTTSSSVEWNDPSPRTCAVMEEIFSKLFTEDNDLNLDFIEKTLTLCPPNEDILLVEDRDHYNLMQKAIIFDSVALVTLLLNHGCEVNGCKSAETCTLSKNKCSHERLGALHLAAFLGRTEIVTLLLQRGCDRTLSKRVYTSAVVNDPDRQQPQLMNSSNFRLPSSSLCCFALELFSQQSSPQGMLTAIAAISVGLLPR